MASLGGVYTDDQEGGVYSELDDEINTELNIDEEPIESPPSSYLQEIEQLRSIINENISVIYGAVQALKTSDPGAYEKQRQMYEEIYKQYNDFLNNAYELQQVPDEQQRKQAIENLDKFLEYTNEILRSMGTEGAGTPGTETNMVTAGDEIVMVEQPGIISGWWRNLQPATRNLIKAVLIGSAIYAGVELIKKKFPGDKKEEEEVEPEIEEVEVIEEGE